MKQLIFKISNFSKDTFFPKERIKSKVQIINILLEASRYILANPNVEEIDSVGEIKLIIDKMSRLFFLSENKYYSIVFPFKLYEEDEKFLLSSFNNIEVNPYLISKTKSAINCDNFHDSCVLDFADSLFEYENESEEVWSFIKELLLLEDGYIRFDNDPIGYKTACEKGTPHKHPTNHYDLFYTNRATFKVGLNKHDTIEEFIDLLDLKTDCRYIKN